MKKTKLSVGIIGLHFGIQHLKGVLANGQEIVAICDISKERLAKISAEYGISEEKCFTNYKDMLNIGLNAVVVATPDMLHREICEAFLSAGVNVLCEKPLALTQNDLCAIVKAEKQSSARFMVGQICRFTPAFVKAKEIVESGAIGELYYVESEYAHDYISIVTDNTNWRAHPDRHGVIGGGCHAVDLLRWIAGDPSEVSAYGTHKLLLHTPNDDATVSILKFPNGVIGKIFVSTGCKRDYTMRTLIYGTKGTVICDNTSDHMTLFTTDENGITKKSPDIIPIDINNHNAVKEIEAFLDAIVNGTEILTTATEGAKSVAACLAIVESSKNGGIPTVPNYQF